MALLRSCADNKECKIVGKYYIPECERQEELYIVPHISILTGKTNIYPETYILELGNSYNVKTPHGLASLSRSMRKEVSKEVFDSVNIGSAYHPIKD